MSYLWGGRMRTVGSDAVGDECKSKTCFRFTETTPGVVGKRSEPTNPAGPATKKEKTRACSRFLFLATGFN
ncbi:hypothetical protein IJI00_02140 [Candidatus Saccharibacteria bacterium]|nr:hypothetical protein [Candidatus Saccharibacteria bacterium]